MVTKGSVLVVDDEINLCRILGAKLAKSGYSVTSVHDGQQAVDRVRESDYDLVLLDLILPKLDGLSVLAEIRRMRSRLPVIVMTACESAEALAQAKGHGVSAYVNKPFDLDNLVGLVRDTTQLNAPARDRRLPDTTVLFIKDQPITLEVVNGSRGKAYCSFIQAKDDQTLSVLAPSHEDRVVEIPPRTCVKVGLAAKDAYYSFTSHVLRLHHGPEHTLVLDKPGVIYRVQRREQNRIMVRVPLGYNTFVEEAEEVELKPGETRDISIGGACIVVPEDVLPGEMLRIELRPKTGKDKISAIAQVMRSKPDSQDGHVLGCRFTKVDDTVRKLLGD